MIMFDLETLGKNAGCPVLSIGVVEFDLNGIQKEYQLFFNVQDQERYELKPEADTVMWWFKQSPEAIKAIIDGQEHALNLAEGLTILSQASDWAKEQVWVNGASFDFPILKALFNAVGIDIPWKYYNECCFRTLKNQLSKTEFEAFRVKPEIAHDGLEDARAQALTLINMLLKKVA